MSASRSARFGRFPASCIEKPELDESLAATAVWHRSGDEATTPGDAMPHTLGARWASRISSAQLAIRVDGESPPIASPHGQIAERGER
jgi:hypothetical protein